MWLLFASRVVVSLQVNAISITIITSVDFCDRTRVWSVLRASNLSKDLLSVD